MTQNLLINNWGISSQIIIDEAKKQWLTTKKLSINDNLFSVSNKNKNIYFKSVDCGINSSFWLKVADNKELTYILAWENNIKVPKSIYINREELWTLNTNSLDIEYPVISKPVDGWHGDGVAIDLKNPDNLSEWLKYSFRDPSVKRVVVQEQIQWEDHRIIVLDEKIIAVSKRIPPYIIWDWESTIESLIDRENNNPKRWWWEDHDGIMSKIKIDNEAISHIEEQGYSISSIPEKWIKLNIRKNSNLSTGGLAIDKTDNIHPSIQQEAIKISKKCWLRFCWVDYFCKDISQELKEGAGAIIEINATPWIRMHHFPSKWKARNVAWILLQEIFK